MFALSSLQRVVPSQFMVTGEELYEVIFFEVFIVLSSSFINELIAMVQQ